jgi:flagellar basal body-associated protein FliL
MSDEQQDLNLEEVGAGAEEAGGPKRASVFSGLILNILKWAAIGIAAVVLVVTTTVVTINIINKGGTSQNLAQTSPAYEAKAEALAYYDIPDSIRGGTSDETPSVFLVRLRIGYDRNAKDLSTEIGIRMPEIEDLILKYMAQKRAADLGAQHWDEIQADLVNLINKIMMQGKIKSLAFREFTVVP